MRLHQSVLIRSLGVDYSAAAQKGWSAVVPVADRPSAYPGDTYNVFPQDNVYVGSHDGQSNDVRNDAGQA